MLHIAVSRRKQLCTCVAHAWYTHFIVAAFLVADRVVYPNLVDCDHLPNHRSRSRSPPDRDGFTVHGSHGVIHTLLISNTLLIASHIVWHTLSIAIACRGLTNTGCVSHPVLVIACLFNNNLIASTCIFAVHDIDHLLYRDHFVDRGSTLHRLIANVTFPMPITTSP